MTRAWRWYLASGVLMAIVYFAVPAAPAKLFVWPAIGWSAVIAILVGIRLHRPTPSAAFHLLAAGVAAFIIGDNLYTFRSQVLGAETVFPSYVDVVYLAMYPLLIAGVIMIDHQRSAGRDRAGAIDTAIITVSVGLVSWVLLIGPLSRLDDTGLLERLTSIAYPLGDVALLATVARLAARSGRPIVHWLTALAVVPLLVSDTVYGYSNLTGSWHEHNVVDIGWIMFYVGCGAVALHPAMGAITPPTNAGRRVTPLRMAIIGSAVLVAPVVLYMDSFEGDVDHAGPIAVASGALFVLVVIRVAGLSSSMAVRRIHEQVRALALHASDAVVVLDGGGRVVFATPSTEKAVGRTVEALTGERFGDLLDAGDAEQLHVMLGDGQATTTVQWTIGRDEHVRHLEVVVTDTSGFSKAAGVVLTLHDVTERTRLNAELRRRALHDTLTDLPNRTLFLDRVQQAVDRARRTDGDPIAVLLVDIDDFKLVNERLGYAAGDHVIAAVAARLRLSLPPGMTIARLGADEFAVLLDDGADDAAVELTAVAIQAAFQTPFTVDDDDTRGVPLRVSIGTAASSTHTDLANDLLRNADLAMYVAKLNGKDRYVRYESGMHEEARRRVEVAAELPDAIRRDELVVFYQPIVDIDSGALAGAEALVRWQHPRRGLLSPSDFVPIAETSGTIIPLGRWVLGEACRAVADWKRSGLARDDFYISVNVSARHVQDPDLLDDVRHALTTSGLDASALVVEVTETTLIDDLDPAGTALAALKELGLRVAVDDFGTGYSSLAYLNNLPLDILKIDKSFVDSVTTSASGENMVRALIDLAHTLHLTVIAEGVEHADQANALTRLGCTLAQGYAFARPMRGSDLAAALHQAQTTGDVIPRH